MMSRSHVAIGFTIGGLLIGSGVLPLSAGVSAGLFLGSIAPDIDTPYSSLGRVLPFISLPLYLSIGHRTATHSVAALVVVLAIAAGIRLEWHDYKDAADAFMIGYWLHIAADLITAEGCVLLYPWPGRIRLWPAVRTGSLSELALVIPACAGLAWLTATYFDMPFRMWFWSLHWRP
jgi:inner membrane protein